MPQCRGALYSTPFRPPCSDLGEPLAPPPHRQQVGGWEESVCVGVEGGRRVCVGVEGGRRVWEGGLRVGGECVCGG